MHLLAGSNEDVLPHIRAVPRGLAECSGDEQKRQYEAAFSVCPQNVPLRKAIRWIGYVDFLVEVP
jgi:hypothetical protein